MERRSTPDDPRAADPEPRPLSAHDPPPETERGRPPVLLIVVIVVAVLAFMLLHLTGVLGPGSH
jgi:hypothetical protein